MARRFGANVVINYREQDPVAEIKKLTDGRGADVAIEALGQQTTFESALRATRPGGTLSSLGVYSGKVAAPYDAFYAGLGDQKIVTTLCPGGKERMRRLMAMVANRRVDLTPLVTHHFGLDDIQEALELFFGAARRRDEGRDHAGARHRPRQKVNDTVGVADGLDTTTGPQKNIGVLLRR